MIQSIRLRGQFDLLLCIQFSQFSQFAQFANLPICQFALIRGANFSYSPIVICFMSDHQTFEVYLRSGVTSLGVSIFTDTLTQLIPYEIILINPSAAKILTLVCIA